MYRNDEGSLIHATSVDGSIIVIFDGVSYAKEISKQSLILHKQSPELALKYLESVQGNISITVENCSASQEHTNM